ncbi:hypothetical protein, partial [Corynebacterium sp. HMSC072D12]|uniref:hypothetical protein n=1 Tax=Corynebacterium sp. HMSC072D12 TaxID=1739447 RepID=UPI001AEF8171
MKSPNLDKQTNQTVHRTDWLSKNYIKKKSFNQPPTRRGYTRRLAQSEDFKQYAQTTYVIYNDAAKRKSAIRHTPTVPHIRHNTAKTNKINQQK